jgi:hypothetical protein
VNDVAVHFVAEIGMRCEQSWSLGHANLTFGSEYSLEMITHSNSYVWKPSLL